MPTRVPKTYDEIVRETVPDPDSSWRPSDEQQRAAYEGFRALDSDEQALFERVEAALASSGADVQQVTAEVERNNVTVRGSVRDAATLARVIDIVHRVDGVGEVVDRLVISDH